MAQISYRRVLFMRHINNLHLISKCFRGAHLWNKVTCNSCTTNHLQVGTHICQQLTGTDGRCSGGMVGGRVTWEGATRAHDVCGITGTDGRVCRGRMVGGTVDTVTREGTAPGAHDVCGTGTIPTTRLRPLGLSP